LPLHLLRAAIDGGLCAEHLYMKLWVLQANWIDRDCGGTKAAVLDYLTCLETLDDYGAGSET
jgi:hypothetical protein